MITVSTVAELEPLVGTELGISSSVTLSTGDIAAFAELTGDRHWLHIDRVRAAAEAPFGDVIAHGFFVLSLVTGLANECYAIERAERWVNYGLERVRFTAPLLPEVPVRLRLVLRDLSRPVGSPARLTLACTVEKEDGAAVMIADWVVLVVEGRA
ncbi:MaoC/PaaZ C-terminal domain-containing protein [Microbacterium sp. RD1]|uniref:MaoC/PaaZ C-terminal domain-containing protein n=1 Tax=Microbacterium sp. RD1 TaxID=3457313 RepID=UPI003FA5BE87